MSSENIKPKRKTRTSSAVKNRYNKKNYKQFATQIKPELDQRIRDYNERENISKPEFLQRAIDLLDK